MDKVSAHSGLPESVELRMLEEKSQRCKEKRESQIQQIMDVLGKMPRRERMALLAEVIKKVKEE